MSHFTYLSFLLALSPLIPAFLAQETNSTGPLIGCGAVGCPGRYECPLNGDDYQGVGLTNIVGAPDSLSELNLVKAVSVDPKGIDKKQQREFKSVFYLDTPSDFNLKSVSGCAVIFHDTLDGLVLKTSDSYETAQVTCPDVMEQQCIDSLKDRARNLDVGNSTGGACDKLADDLKETPIDACKNLSGTNKGVGRFSAISLSNATEIQKSQSQNGSAECWPVEDKSDKLARLGEDTVMGGYNASEILDEAWLKITPVLTVFFAEEGNDTLVNETSSQLTCLKLVREARQPGDPLEPGENGNDAMIVRTNVFALCGVLVVAVFISLH